MTLQHAIAQAASHLQQMHSHHHGHANQGGQAKPPKGLGGGGSSGASNFTVYDRQPTKAQLTMPANLKNKTKIHMDPDGGSFGGGGGPPNGQGGVFGGGAPNMSPSGLQVLLISYRELYLNLVVDLFRLTAVSNFILLYDNDA